MGDLILLPNLVGAVIFSLVGCLVLILVFKVLNWMTPSDLWHEIIEDHNSALAIIIGALAIGMSLIISAAIKG